MLRTPAIITLALVATSSAELRADHHEQEMVALKSLIAAGRKHHPTLAKKPLLVDSLRLQSQKLDRGYWPKLSLIGRANWQSDVTSVDIAIPNVMIAVPPKDQYKVAFELQQSLWDGGVISRKKRIARSRSLVEDEKANLQWYEVRGRILQLYFAGVVQQELEQQAHTLESHLGTVVKEARVGLKSGVLTRRDVLLVEARQLEARQAIADADAQLRSIRRSLSLLTGTHLGQQTRLAPLASNCKAATEDANHVAVLRRPELGVLAAQASVLAAEEQLNRVVDRPRIGAFATAGYGRPGLNALSNQFDSYFIGGVQLTVPLTYLYAGTRKNDREQLAVQRSLISRQEQAVKTQIEIQLAEQRAELHRLESNLEIDEQLVQAREQARKQTDLQLSLGTATMTELVDDLSLEDRARTTRAVHRAQRSLACHQLAFIKGEL